MEKLAALFFLRKFGLCDKDDYSAELDGLFLANPDDEFLLALECGDNGDDISAALKKRITDKALFERELFKALGEFYSKRCVSGDLTLFLFCERCFELGGSLDIDRELWNALMSPHYTFEHMDELPQTDEEIIDGIKRKFRDIFDAFKEIK